MFKYLLLACLFSVSLSSDILLSRNKLSILDAASHIDLAAYEQHPEINDLTPELVENGYGKRSIVYGSEVWYGGGYEHFYAPIGNVFPKLILYNVTGDELQLTSKVLTPKDVGVTSSTFSPAADHPYGVVITYESATGSILEEQAFVLEKYAYDDQGDYDQTPERIELYTIDPTFYNLTAAYVGNPGISDDGKYILVTYSTGDGVPGVKIGRAHV